MGPPIWNGRKEGVVVCLPPAACRLPSAICHLPSGACHLAHLIILGLASSECYVCSVSVMAGRTFVAFPHLPAAYLPTQLPPSHLMSRLSPACSCSSGVWAPLQSRQRVYPNPANNTIPTSITSTSSIRQFAILSSGAAAPVVVMYLDEPRKRPSSST
jgi:hypothetical protein